MEAKSSHCPMEISNRFFFLFLLSFFFVFVFDFGFGFVFALVCFKWDLALAI